MRGRNASSRCVGWRCDGRLPRGVICTRRNAAGVRRSRVVLAPRLWRLSGPPVRARQRGQERPFPGESAKQAVKPLRGESRDVLAVPVKPVCISFSLQTAHGCFVGAAGARLSLRPQSSEGQRDRKTRTQTSRGNEKACVLVFTRRGASQKSKWPGQARP